MKKIISLLLTTGLLSFSFVAITITPVSAQVSCSPVGATINGSANSNGPTLASETCLAQIEATLVKNLTNTTKTSGNTTSQLSSLVQQYKDQYLSGLNTTQLTNFGNTLSSTMKSNLQSLTAQTNINGQISGYFSKTFPAYQQGQDYSSYMQQLRQNTLNAYQQSFGTADTQVQNEHQAAVLLRSQMQSGSPTTQMQALQKMVALSQFQISQMDNLLQVQSSMLKGMQSYWNEQLAQQKASEAASTSTNAQQAAFDKTISENPFAIYGGCKTADCK